MRLLVHVEGQTEETFVNEVLSGYLRGFGYSAVSARLMGNARQRQERGGVKPWHAVRRDVLRHLAEDGGAVATTMVDYYGMPVDKGRDWPGTRDARSITGSPLKAKHVERLIHEDVVHEMGNGFDPRRFVPFVIMHEFEGLLFSDCGAFSRGIHRPDLEGDLQAVRNAFATPEDINDSALTAPSKRIKGLFPGYEKPLHGNVAAIEIGLEAIRAQCSHFSEWLNVLQRTPSSIAGNKK